MKGQSEGIHDPGLKIQTKVSSADIRNEASNISSSLLVMSCSYLHMLTHFFLYSLFYHYIWTLLEIVNFIVYSLDCGN